MAQTMPSRRRIILASIATILYGASLLLPAASSIFPRWRPEPLRGYEAFELALEGLTEMESLDHAILFLGWCANPLILVGIAALAMGRCSWAAVTGAAALLLVLSLLPWVVGVVYDQPGYWLWAASATFVFVTGIRALVRGTSRPGENFERAGRL